MSTGLTGQQTAVALGTLQATVERALTGLQIASDQGELSIAVTVQVHGQTVTVYLGALDAGGITNAASIDWVVVETRSLTVLAASESLSAFVEYRDNNVIIEA
jgi:hypothetical protein